ncbi:MAG: ribosomal protein S18-alanine N-acetyltransferase [Thaumarchaeota archaeon]|nr:ribosomal protein S18-alanine N-acetyltransferase [Nitrososphaerota archaeon]
MQKSVLAKVGDYEIRRCDRDDVPAIIDINMKTLPEHYSDYFYYEILGEFPETFLVAELGGELVGYIMCRVEYGFSHLRRLGLARKGHVVSVAVTEEHRGKGIGSRLMVAAQEEMEKKTATESYLEVRVSNQLAISLYDKLGYKVTNRLEAYYRDGEGALVMAIQLGK